MASIRRTLSPVPRPGISLSGEACSVASPLSKSSSSTQNYPSSSSVLSSSSSSFSSLDYSVYRLQAFVLGLFSKRPSRPVERPKSKGQTWWRAALLQFFICFMAGVFIGLTPLISTNFSTNLIMSKHQVFSFEQAQIYDDIMPPKNVTPLLESGIMNDNSTQEPNLMKRELMNGISDDDTQLSVNQDLGGVVVFHKLLIIVTPTYARPFQACQMTRLAHTLKLVQPPLLWVVVEMGSQSTETADILRRTGVVYRHLECKMNSSLEVKDHRGAHQRNVALSHIETHRLDGIVYFADDDNVYSADLFEQLRQISMFGTWMVAKLMEGNSKPDMEGPICNGTQVIGWHTNDVSRKYRRFYTEMSGFAFNSTVLWDLKRWHRPTLEPIRQLDTVKESFQVSTFIEQVLEDESQMECVPQDNSSIMVWHLPVESSYFYPSEWFMKHNLDVIAPLA